MMYRVGFLTSHPIQYQAPVFRCLAKMPDLDLTVLFCQIPDARTRGEGFDIPVDWDIPLLDGYQHVLLKNVARTPSVTAFSGCDTPEIGRQIRDRAFDAVIVNGWVVKSCLQALWGCVRAGVPCLVRGEANDLRPRAWWKCALQRQLVNQYSACLYIGEANKHFYKQRGIPETRLFSSPYCVDNSRFLDQMPATDRLASRERFGLQSKSTVFLFCGKLIPKKCPLELLSVVRDISNRVPNFELLVVGDGALRSQCEDFAQRYSLPVRFAGFLNQSSIVQAYSAADCLVLPSDHGETWGLVVNEAMACGKPAIVSDLVGCAADLITPGETGTTFQFGNWSDLACKLTYYCEFPTELDRMGTNALNRIASYSPQRAADGIRQAVASILSSPEST